MIEIKGQWRGRQLQLHRVDTHLHCAPQHATLFQSSTVILPASDRSRLQQNTRSSCAVQTFCIPRKGYAADPVTTLPSNPGNITPTPSRPWKLLRNNDEWHGRQYLLPLRCRPIHHAPVQSRATDEAQVVVTLLRRPVFPWSSGLLTINSYLLSHRIILAMLRWRPTSARRRSTCLETVMRSTT